jgi:GT2 family glycosyltransferase
MARLAVVIPTRNRGGEAAETVRAVLQDPLDFELVVVDQSTDDRTFEALKAVQSDPRVKVIRSTQSGASNARNAGVAATTAPIIAFTDDDCRPAPNWASCMLSIFESNPDASLVFGRVHLPPLENEGDYAPSFEPRARIQEGSVPLPSDDLGIGANFGIRRDVLASLGGFDPLLGPGAPVFRGAEETDLLIRGIFRGLRVINAAECDVLHLGVRTGADVRPLHMQYQFAVGAAFAKHARLGGVAAVRDAARWVKFYTLMSLRDAASLKKPRAGVLWYFVSGAVSTFRYGVDPQRHVFAPRS